MNLRPVLSGLIGAAIGLGLLWAVHAAFFSPHAAQQTASPKPSSPQQIRKNDNIIELEPAEQTVEVTTAAPAQEIIAPETQPKPETAPEFKTPQDPASLAKEYMTVQDALLAGDKASSDGRKDLAVACFRRATELDPRNVTALQALAIAFMADNQLQKTAEVYEHILEINPSNQNAMFNLAVTYVRLKKYDRAEEIYRDFLDAHPKDIKARTNMATLLQIQNRRDEARQQWHKVAMLDSKRADAWEHVGEISVDLGEPMAAMDAYAHAAKIAPDDPVIWKNFATTARRAGSAGRAIFAYKKALALEPDNAVTWKDLGDVFLEVYRVRDDKNIITQAVTAWQQSLKLNPKQPDVEKLLSIYAPSAAAKPQQ